MARKDPRVTAYVAAARPFARPVLREIRAAVREACPEVEETLKWGMPAFVHRGLLGGMAAFKGHAALWLWRGKLLKGLGRGKGGAMGQFGRLTSVADLPAHPRLVALLREAAALDEALGGAPGPRGSARGVREPGHGAGPRARGPGGAPARVRGRRRARVPARKGRQGA